MRWPIAPLKRAMSGHSPVLRYALRVTIALLVGYVIGLHLPWAAHPFWLMLSVAVVLRASGLSPLGPIAVNTMAPDEGNIFLLGKIGTPWQKEHSP